MRWLAEVPIDSLQASTSEVTEYLTVTRIMRTTGIVTQTHRLTWTAEGQHPVLRSTRKPVAQGMVIVVFTLNTVNASATPANT